MRQGGTIELLLHGEVYVGVTHIRMISHKYEHLKQTVFLKKVLDMPWTAYSADFATRFRRNPPPCSDAKRHGVPVESATPGRSV